MINHLKQAVTKVRSIKSESYFRSLIPILTDRLREIHIEIYVEVHENEMHGAETVWACVCTVMLATSGSWGKCMGRLASLFRSRFIKILRRYRKRDERDRGGPSATRHLHRHLRSYNSPLCRSHRRVSRTSCERKGDPKNLGVPALCLLRLGPMIV